MTKTSHKLWQGRSDGSVDDITVEMGESISLDIELYKEDTFGSSVHARMLHRIGLLNDKELEDILNGLRTVRAEIEAGKMELRPDLEDIHTHVENRLIELTGDAGRKLHTARSRNDQVALDTHLFVRRACVEIAEGLRDLCGVLSARAEENTAVIIPGYTHLQPAQPVRLSHHLLAHFWGFARDAERFAWVREESDRLPLGSGAMAGVNYETDREFLRQELGFRELYPNSMDAVANRDHILNFLFACSVLAGHASRVAEEIILWNSVEYGFISLPDSLTTGSSIMPQKKNPDLAELIRGKTGRANGNLMNLLTNIKGLPFTYNRDLQEDRAPLLDARYQALLVIRALTAMMREMTFHGDKTALSLEKGFVTATDLADALVADKGVPFREAHHLVGRLVALCVEENCFLSNASAELRARASEHFRDDAFYAAAVDLEKSADKKVSAGGTALARQQEQLTEAAAQMEKLKSHPWPDTSYEF